MSVTTLVVFSMDRALQCDSLLRSVDDHVTGVERVIVIARATSELHARAYGEITSDCMLLMEKPGRSCSMLLADAVGGTDHIALAVDDQVFYRSSDFVLAVSRLGVERAFVWSWRLGHKPGVTTRWLDHWICSAAGTRDESYRYLFHSDGALYRRDDYVHMLDTYVPGWQTRALIPNDLEAGPAAAQRDWQMSVGPHVGPLEATCMTWQLNKQSTTEGRYGAPWCTIPETKLDALAEAFLAGKRVDNARLYEDTSWTTRFQQPDSLPTHVHACEEASHFYADLIR
jgi:hypothetical protein